MALQLPKKQMKRIKFNISTIFLLILWSCEPSIIIDSNSHETFIPATLPFKALKLLDISELNSEGQNWNIVGQVHSDFTRALHVETKEGTGILVNQPTNEERAHIFSTFEHGDIELDLEFMMPKGSNSGIYFQSRYEIQLFDSWGKQNLTSQDCGSIYERWDNQRPEEEKGYEGHAPKKNVNKAPGLWQHLHIKFKSPKFDSLGNKLANAIFEEVTHNGILIHKDIEVTGPTRSAFISDQPELPKAALMLQGDHGPVAFRNIKYKLFGADTLRTSNIEYQYFEVPMPLTKLPHLDTLTPKVTGKVAKIDVNKLSQRRDGIAFKFWGELNVPLSGDYLFDLLSDDGSALFIDQKQIINHDGKHDFESKKGIVNLKEGTHSFQINYFNYTWGKGLWLKYEGPEQEIRTLQGLYPYPLNNKKNTLLVDPNETPEMIRSFVNYKEEKRTHTISVGDPQGVHYSYDLTRGSLLKVWKGGFADVTEMWEGRGIDQLLIPQEMSVELNEHIIASQLNKDSTPYPFKISDNIHPQGYRINDDKRPIFIYNYGNLTLEDHYQPNIKGNGIQRSLSINGDTDLYSRVARADYIEKINDEFYSVGGHYYFKNLGESQPIFREIEGFMELIYALEKDKKIVYSLFW
ncbi:MAG: hypothetical protein CMB82_01475 [Flammeovirgaceae bacterium]|nr:hypothetical protein [Flammeovirgaceae bacterium]